MTASAQPSGSTPSLWDQAFDSLDIDLRSGLNSARTHKRDILEAVLKEVETKRELAIRKRWKFKKPNGDVIVVRDVLEKIAKWINRFKETGDVVIQYDPAHLALPWAAFRFLLQTSISEIEVFGALVDDLENIARIVARFGEFERVYQQGTRSGLELMIQEALTRLYAAILIHLAHAVKFFGEKSLVRVLKSPFHTADDKQMHQILAQEAEVLKIATLTDSDRLLNLDAAVTRLSVQANMYSQSLSEQKYNKCLEWLSVSPFYSYHQFVSQSRLANLGKWIFTHQDYMDWQTSSSSSLLLIHGIIGSGKSTLCSMIVDSLLSAAENDPSTAPFGYFYCANPDFEKARLSSDAVMRSIISQLALDRTGQRSIKDFLYSEYERQMARTKVVGHDLPKLRTRDCIRLILEHAEQNPLTIIIDAMDTVEQNERHTLISAIKEIVLKADNVVKILITSRSDNRTMMKTAANKHIQITSLETQQDMKSFIDHLLDTAVTSMMLLEGRVSPDLRNLLIKTLLDGCGEMFLWVKLQIERLCREKTEDDVVTALQNKLPEGLDQLYQESLSHIFKTGTTARDTAIKTFSWILHMREPLTPSALLTVVSNAQNSAMRFSDLMPLCANLIVLDKNRNVVRFAHQSVKEFLERHDAFTGPVAHNSLASTCIEACSRGPIFEGSLKLPSDDFYVYAAMYWPVHLAMAEVKAANSDIVNQVTSFIFDEDFDTSLSFDSWLGTRGELVSILANDHALKIALDAIPDGNAGFLFLISVFGLTALLRVVLEHVVDLDVDQMNTHGHTPAYLAATLGHSATLSMLVDHGANINVKCGRYGSPLHAACFAGHLETVKILLELGASISCGVVFEDALQAACRGGHEDVALHLISGGYIVKSEADYDSTLESATREGFVNVLEMLDRPPFLCFNRSKPDKIMKKTRRAIQGGQLGVIRHFLHKQTNKGDVIPPDAVNLAILYNHKDLVDFLLDEGMSVESEGAVGTPLRTACLLNYQPIARLLLNRGAEINACGNFGDALQAAAMKGHTMIMKLMIDEGANVNQQSGFYGTALQAAAYHGHHGTVELLLDAGADVHAEGYSKDAFHAAAEGGHQDIIMLMLQKGYKLYHPPPGPLYCRPAPSPYKALMRDASPGRASDTYRRRWSPWTSTDISPNAKKPTTELEAIFGSAESEPEMAQLNTEEVQTTGYKPGLYEMIDNYPLEAAASAGHKDIVNLLLEKRDVLGIQEDEISRAINRATTNSHWLIVELLLEDIAKRYSVKSEIESMLKIASQRRQSPIVDLALDQASKYCSADEIFEMKQTLVTAADRYRLDTEVSQDTLILDFAKGCEDGDIHVIDAMLSSKHHEALSPFEIDAGLQLCVLKEHGSVVSMLHESPSLNGRLPPLCEEPFVVAAGGGSLKMMELLTSYWTEELTTASADSVTRALVVACENGHIDVVRYLVQHISADVNTLAHDKPVGPGLNKEDWDESLFAIASYGSDSQARADNEKPEMVPVISPLQAALRGFSRFDNSGIIFWEKNQPRKANESQHEEVIVFLIENRSKLDDLGGQNVYPLQLAARFCAVHIVEKFIAANTDVNATNCGESALFAAAGRELSAAPIVRRLLSAGAIIPREIEKQNALLEQALCYFQGDTSRDYFDGSGDPDGRFLVAPSLEYVFKEGSGAVLFDLLSQMPQITTIDIRWTLALQMAAFLDNHRFVDLLLFRGTNVNANGYYCGTALAAAARWGHITTVQKLLKAGAEVNVLRGRWETALRAALLGGHAAVVETLLDHGADMKLSPTGRSLYDSGSENASNHALYLGVQSGSLSIVKTLLRHGAKAVHGGDETLHPLILASKQGSVAIVKELLKAGAPVNIPGKKRYYYLDIVAEDASPIHAAVANGYLDVVQLLLSNGADIETDVKGSGTPLSVAASNGRVDIVRLLLSAEARAIDGAALNNAVREGSIEIVQELLAAGSKVEPVLALACRRGNLPMIEFLLEKIYDGEKPDTVMDEVFSTNGLDDSVFRILLDFAHPTMHRFVQVCAAGSVASAEMMLDRGDIDINGQIETDGDYPLQIAALHLQVEVARFLLMRGADVNCKSSKHGTPLITVLEACAASRLRELELEKAKELVDQLHLPSFDASSPSSLVDQSQLSYFDDSGPSNFQQISDCVHIVQLLTDHGANIADDSRPFGSPMHLACLLGNEDVVELLLEKGAEISCTAGFFEKTIFAAIQGGNANIVEILLRQAPLTKHIHPSYATPLHLACANGCSAAIRKLLEHGADATVRDSKGWTPLTIALDKQRQGGISLDDSHSEAPLEIILKLADPIHVVNGDLVIAAELGDGDAEKTVALLLDLDRDVIVSEAVICQALELPNVNGLTLQFFMQRNGGIGVTAKMLTTVRTYYHLKELLKHRPICQITPEILKSQEELECIKILMEIDSEMPVTEEIIFRALEIGNVWNRRHGSRKQEGREVLETLLDRNPDICVSEEMLKAVRCATDMEILLNRLDPGTCISTGVVAAVSNSNDEADETMRLLLKFDPSVELDHETILRVMTSRCNALNALEMFLEHDPSMPVSEEIFLQVFGRSREIDRGRLVKLMQKHHKRLVLTKRVRGVIDHAYQRTSETNKKQQFYNLGNHNKNQKMSSRKPLNFLTSLYQRMI